MRPDTDNLIARLHESPLRCVAVFAGAGSVALSWILAVPGASRTVLEATVPYSEASLVDLLGGRPASLASRETAEAMAQVAFERALDLREAEYPVVGLACTAAIRTDRPKRGPHRAHVAVRSASGLATYGLALEKGLRDRSAEEEVVSLLILRALATAADLNPDINLGLAPGEKLEMDLGPPIGADPIDLLMAGAVRWVYAGVDGGTACEAGILGGVLPGSFNPLHRGHAELWEAARRVLGTDVTFELSAANVDKPDLTRDELAARLGQFSGRFPVALTRAERFHHKARLFPGSCFVIGYDTAVRLVDPVYHGGNDAGVRQDLDTIRHLGCRFLVAGRQVDGEFRSLAHVRVPDGFGDMFAGLAEAEFRYDGSSTDLREVMAQPGGGAG